ncbi:hypothetical protein COU78_05060 [Candidatus Peregrinibacteria bacterium CG10_big_fil_rev_8_21_14_0_10_49_24]|nr:MAG: hypothetical protein COV83_01430 [Candidatus Peregrinibacteria bacterium CG11_big_fil_rev_8_21_14_0_20_49_14]PIR50717.1 MAG: hypothetical protein COU78_05060 [Candidatus Peregrinibacteria bacterium CG10_big_fil_rev_8_21_14_0_10_49_24]PJA68239.1 MAG: hypothetical protein CO157_00750 [Candidatus Peregrinibacteria bacterium CG_4_9_14_3_um_filter_49_12]
MTESPPDPETVAALMEGWLGPDDVQDPAVRTEALLASLAQPEDLEDVRFVAPVQRDRIIDLIIQKAEKRGIRLPEQKL